MDLLFTGSIIAAFFGGLIALFAPCCITVLLPVYLASVFKEKKKILMMTLLYFLGIAVILIPIALGLAALAKIFSVYHFWMYIIGGLFIILIGLMTVIGKEIPWPVPKPRILKGAADPLSIFLLGIFSGAATSCCAPVLLGVIALTAVSANVLWAFFISLAYVFGMVFPLFLFGLIYDKLNVKIPKPLKLGNINLMNLIGGMIFILMGLILVYLAFSGQEFFAPQYQKDLYRILISISNGVIGWLNLIPQFIWGIILVSLIGFFIYRAVKS